MPGLGAGSPGGGMRGQTHQCSLPSLSPSLALSFPLSLKINLKTRGNIISEYNCQKGMNRVASQRLARRALLSCGREGLSLEVTSEQRPGEPPGASRAETRMQRLESTLSLFECALLKPTPSSCVSDGETKARSWALGMEGRKYKRRKKETHEETELPED